MQISSFYGRLIIKHNIDVTAYPALEMMPAIKDNVCQRCFNTLDQQWQLPNGIRYCGLCLKFGRITTADTLVTIPEPNMFPSFSNWQWGGVLTRSQQRVVNEIKKHTHNHLVWAVTGAGKTEILFPIIAQALISNQRICIAAPRIDVILELVPRITVVFPTIPIAVLYGQNKEPYRYTQLVICTTHQLLHFRAAFDLLIIDEVDSFPFAGNQLLKNAPQTALKLTGRLIVMTATPTRKHLMTFKQRSYLPARFHGYPLPKIETKVVNKWRILIKNRQLPICLKSYFEQNNQGYQCLVFVPTIHDVTTVTAAIHQQFPDVKLEGVFAQDPERMNKVQLMRNREIQYLVTTTILERGVTLPDIDVIILGADHHNFNSRSLIQIAGRVGRKTSRPTGMVLAIMSTPSLQVLVAQMTIKWLNYQATKGDKDDL